MRNAPRLAPQLAQNSSFCANYKRKYCGFETNTLSSHTRLTKRIVGLLSFGFLSFSLERGSLFGCGSLSLSLSQVWVSIRLWLSLSSVGLSSAVALSLIVGLSHPTFRSSLLQLSLVVGLSHASCFWKLAKCYCVVSYELLILG